MTKPNLESGPTEPSGMKDEKECPRSHEENYNWPCEECGATK